MVASKCALGLCLLVQPIEIPLIHERANVSEERGSAGGLFHLLTHIVLIDGVYEFTRKITSSQDHDQDHGPIVIWTCIPIIFSRKSLFALLHRMWWTITGNFGNILPIDWTKSYARQMHMPALQLGANQPRGANGVAGTAAVTAKRNDANSNSSSGGSSSDEDEAVANDLDMHALILGGMQHMDTDAPIQTVEEVIKEIDDLMDETTPSDCGESMATAMGNAMEKSEAMEKAKEVLGAPLYAESKCADADIVGGIINCARFCSQNCKA